MFHCIEERNLSPNLFQLGNCLTIEVLRKNYVGAG